MRANESQIVIIQNSPVFTKVILAVLSYTATEKRRPGCEVGTQEGRKQKMTIFKP